MAPVIEVSGLVKRYGGMDDRPHAARSGGVRHRSDPARAPRRSGFPVERFAITVLDQKLSIAAEAAIVLTFGVVMLAIAVRSFQRRD